MKSKYLWFTDTHLPSVSIFNKLKFLFHLRKEKPEGIFLTGDISNGLFLKIDLKLIRRFANCPIYFILGNHDYYFSSFDSIHNKIKHIDPDIIWLRESGVVELNKTTALIGVEGWYDGFYGDPSTITLSTSIDRLWISEMRNLNKNEILKFVRKKANEDAKIIINNLQNALDAGYETIYLLTHFPPWAEATRDLGKCLENFWLPYNVNSTLGFALEKIMKDKSATLHVLAGHVHEDKFIQVSSNIFCKVNKAKFTDSLRNEEHIFL